MTPRQQAIANLKKFLNKSEANRALPKPEAKPAEAQEEAMSPEALEALRSITSGE